MSCGHLIEHHRQMEADAAEAVKPVSIEDASRPGILKLAPNGLISDFIEKPQVLDLLNAGVSRDDLDLPSNGSMGLYLFHTEVLIDLRDSAYDDFGGGVIPAAIESLRVAGYTFDDYWDDLGTICAFYNANLALAQPDPPCRFHDSISPVYTARGFCQGHVFMMSRLIAFNWRMDVWWKEPGCRMRSWVIAASSLRGPE